MGGNLIGKIDILMDINIVALAYGGREDVGI